MENDWRVFFCDEVSEGLFGKLNLIGYIPSQEIFIDQPNYIFRTTLVAEGTVKKNVIGQEVKIELGVGEGELTPRLTVASIPPFEPESYRLFFTVPIDWSLPGPGRFIVNLYFGDVLVHDASFQVTYGNAPNIRIGKRLGTSGLIEPGTNTFKLPALIQSASRELIFVDQFLPPDALLDLLNVVPDKNIKIRVLTAPKYYKIYEQATDILRKVGFTNISIRFSEAFHDRYVILNGTEAYKFGYSLKDLGKKRLSSYSKIVIKNEIERTLKNFEVQWAAAYSSL